MMCGRFTLTVDAHQIREAFPWITLEHEVQPRYNIAPSQPIALVPNDGLNRLDYYIWGLIPSWSKDPSIGNRLINARGETLDEKPAFKTAFKRRRCLILSDGFYEWHKEPGTSVKVPIYIKMKNKRPFGFAGLWETWQAQDGSEVRSCTIITTEPNELIKKYHNRMPAILAPDAYKTWLLPEEGDLKKLKHLLMPYNSGEMMAYPVSRVVNNPINESPECIIPV